VRLLLDENVSPSIVHALREAGHDVYHVRDRGLIGRPDHVIWRRAVAESRVVVTINTHDFVRLARREELHAGPITFPSGSTSEQQSWLILRAITAFEVDRGVRSRRLRWFPYMDMINVIPDHRNRGIGTALFERWEEVMRENGATLLMASSESDESEPQAWHRRNGFHEAGSISRLQPVAEVFFVKDPR
jgi:predicted nuclease of predicted toxin-antitoxin system